MYNNFRKKMEQPVRGERCSNTTPSCRLIFHPLTKVDAATCLRRQVPRSTWITSAHSTGNVLTIGQAEVANKFFCPLLLTKDSLACEWRCCSANRACSSSSSSLHCFSQFIHSRRARAECCEINRIDHHQFLLCVIYYYNLVHWYLF